MSFLKGFEKIVSKDDLRPSLQNVLFKDGFAIATDAHKLVKVDLKLYGLDKEDISNLEGCVLDLEVLNELKLKKGQTLSFSKKKIEVNSKGRKKPLKVIELMDEKELGIVFPKFGKVLGSKEKEVSAISVNTQFILDVENVYNNLPSTEINKRELLTLVFCEGSKIRIQNFDGSFEGLVMMRKLGEYKDLSK